MDHLGHATIFTKINLASAYHQAEVYPDHKYSIAVQVHFGLFECIVIPPGLCNALAIFIKLMNRMFNEALNR